MTFKALLYKCYARRVRIGAKSEVQGARAHLEFFRPLDNLGPLLAPGSNNKNSNKIIAKMLHLNTQKYK